MHYRTLRPIATDQELLVWYGAEYAAELGIYIEIAMRPQCLWWNFTYSYYSGRPFSLLGEERNGWSRDNGNKQMPNVRQVVQVQGGPKYALEEELNM